MPLYIVNVEGFGDIDKRADTLLLGLLAVDLSLCKMRLRRAHQLEKELDRLLTESAAPVPTPQHVDLALGITRLRVMARQELQRAASDAKERRRP